MNQALVNGYSGRTSVQSEGFDPCVVPTLIDYEAGRMIVDTLPNGALFYGIHPGADCRPDILKWVMGTVYDYKIMVLEAMIAANADDSELVVAYRSKIAKESGGR
ncbi:hypothetical protein ACYU03_02000 [Pseudomonas sp. X10]